MNNRVEGMWEYFLHWLDGELIIIFHVLWKGGLSKTGKLVFAQSPIVSGDYNYWKQVEKYSKKIVYPTKLAISNFHL